MLSLYTRKCTESWADRLVCFLSVSSADRSQSVGPASSNVDGSPKRQVRSGSAAPAASSTAASKVSKKTPASTPIVPERRPRPSKWKYQSPIKRKLADHFSQKGRKSIGKKGTHRHCILSKKNTNKNQQQQQFYFSFSQTIFHPLENTWHLLQIHSLFFIFSNIILELSANT